MARDSAALEKLLHAIRPKDLHNVSRTVLHGLHSKISDALAEQDDLKERAKPPGQKSDAEYQRWSREMIAKAKDIGEE